MSSQKVTDEIIVLKMRPEYVVHIVRNGNGLAAYQKVNDIEFPIQIILEHYSVDPQRGLCFQKYSPVIGQPFLWFFSPCLWFYFVVYRWGRLRFLCCLLAAGSDHTFIGCRRRCLRLYWDLFRQDILARGRRLFLIRKQPIGGLILNSNLPFECGLILGIIFPSLAHPHQALQWIRSHLSRT